MRLTKNDKTGNIDRHAASRDLKIRKQAFVATDNRKSVELIARLGATQKSITKHSKRARSAK